MGAGAGLDATVRPRPISLLHGLGRGGNARLGRAPFLQHRKAHSTLPPAY